MTASVLSSDGKQDPDVMAANATSAALMLSDIPWAGPIGMIRIGRIEGQFIVNPTMDEVMLNVNSSLSIALSTYCVLTSFLSASNSYLLGNNAAQLK